MVCQRLFVGALGNNTVEVVDLSAGNCHDISDLEEPQGIRYIPNSDKVVRRQWRDGSVRVFDGSSFCRDYAHQVLGDADNVRYDRR